MRGAEFIDRIKKLGRERGVKVVFESRATARAVTARCGSMPGRRRSRIARKR
jgi:hypothetical protein